MDGHMVNGGTCTCTLTPIGRCVCLEAAEAHTCCTVHCLNLKPPVQLENSSSTHCDNNSNYVEIYSSLLMQLSIESWRRTSCSTLSYTTPTSVFRWLLFADFEWDMVYGVMCILFLWFLVQGGRRKAAGKVIPPEDSRVRTTGASQGRGEYWGE